jgi:serine/threonine protein kinase
MAVPLPPEPRSGTDASPPADSTRSFQTSPDGSAGARSAATPAKGGLPASPNRYELHAEIGRGGMGVVYRAIDAALGREVAVKVLHEPADSPAARRFIAEAIVTAHLQHPGIPAVHDIGMLPDGRPFVVMKLIQGRTLAELLKESISRDALRGRCLAIFEQVCRAVAYAHEQRVIHRDLKPANVMVGAFGDVQIMDWGLAKILPGPERQPGQAPDLDATLGAEMRSTGDSDQLFTHPGSILGTPAFMAPEQANGVIDQIDERSDVFALGAILCAILTGQPPYVHADSERARQLAAQAKLDDAFARLDASRSHSELVALCKRCLSADKSDRPPNAAEVAKAVTTWRSAADESALLAQAGETIAYVDDLMQLLDGVKNLNTIVTRTGQSWLKLCTTLQEQGDLEGAIRACYEAIDAAPIDPIAHNHLAWLLATGPDRIRDGPLAIKHSTTACDLTDWKLPSLLDTLAVAHAEAGDFDKAVEYQEKALACDFPEYQKMHGAGARQRLDLYRRKMPYRDPALLAKQPSPGRRFRSGTWLRETKKKLSNLFRTVFRTE